MKISDLITQTEAGKLRGVTRPAIYSLINYGHLKLIKKGKKAFVSRKEVLALKPFKAHRQFRSNQEILDDLIRVKQYLGYMATPTQYRKLGRITLSLVYRRFGKWADVVSAVNSKVVREK